MPISKQEKAKTHARIVDRAANLFRRNGFNNVGIDAIMAAARLTRGGFYSHFRSKRALLTEVIKQDYGLPRMLRTREGLEAETLAAQANAIISDYLNPAHRREVASGCTLSALALDSARADRATQNAYSEKIAEVAAEYARGVPNAKPNDPKVLCALVLSIGGLTMTRAMGSSPLSDDISNACRDEAIRLLAASSD